MIYLVAAFLICIGTWGIILKNKSLLHVLMSFEVMLLGVSIHFVTASVERHDIHGQVISLFLLALGAAEAAIGLALFMAYFQYHSSIWVNDMVDLKDDPS